MFFVGGRPQADDVLALGEAGVTHIISCLPEQERNAMAFLATDFNHMFVPLHDGIHADISSAFPSAFDFVREAQATCASAKVLVHCQVGVSRSAALTIAMLMKSSGESFFDTFMGVRARRPEVLPNIGFASQLQHLEHAMSPSNRAPASANASYSSLTRYLREVCKVPAKMELIEEYLQRHDYNAPQAIRAMFGNEIPRVVQGVRL